MLKTGLFDGNPPKLRQKSLMKKIVACKTNLQKDSGNPLGVLFFRGSKQFYVVISNGPNRRYPYKISRRAAPRNDMVVPLVIVSSRTAEFVPTCHLERPSGLATLSSRTAVRPCPLVISNGRQALPPCHLERPSGLAPLSSRTAVRPERSFLRFLTFVRNDIRVRSNMKAPK